MAQPAQIPEGNRVPHIYPTDFWTERVEKIVKRPTKKEVEVRFRNAEGQDESRMEERTVYVDEVEYVDEDFVRWVRKGDIKSANVIKVRIMRKTDPDAWKVIEPFYTAWKKQENLPENGTPLRNWPLIRNKRQVQELELMNIRTVEDLASIPDSLLGNLGMGGRDLRDKAKNFIDVAGNEAKFATILTSRDEQIASQQAQIDELQRNLQQITARLPQREMPGDAKKE